MSALTTGLAPGVKYCPPPTRTETTVMAYAHCPDPRCPGVQQVQVQAINEVTEWTLASRGGGDEPHGLYNILANVVENSQSRLRFLNDGADAWGNQDPNMPNELPCPHCGKSRELSAEERPNYPIMVGGANALLRLQEMGIQFDPQRQQEIAKGAPETPTELLQRRYISDEISHDEYVVKLAAIGGTAPAPAPVESAAAQDERIAAMQAQINQLLGLVQDQQSEAKAPKRAPKAPAGGTGD